MPIQTKRYKIRHLRRHEIPQLLQICHKEGRHMGTTEEVESWLQFDPKGFFVAVDDDGVILGSCCGIRLSGQHGYVGMYVVSAEWRGCGIGKQIWNAAIHHLGHRNNGLSAVSHLFQLYRDKAGFCHIADWTVDLYKLNHMHKLYQYIASDHSINKSDTDIPIYQLNYDMSEFCTVSVSPKLRTKPINDKLIADVIAYDRRLHSYDRSKIVRLTVRESKCRTRVALLGDTVVGYGCIKPNLQNHWMITPLYADNEYIARMLLCDLLSGLSMLELDEGVVLKTPSNNNSAINLLKMLGFEKQTYSLKRCYTRQVFDVPTHHIYALHTSVFCTE
ncbi:uncharacterized protein LOC128965499 [Oppia nitens]|uniref:uncharacterized protein LOC128965499 n=1 Tax=Oppia nitens TaxID=1686743 RepID=UPI0023DC8D7B|nr:uncharacterized protein LOC128965499 [Oppia nitens]